MAFIQQMPPPVPRGIPKDAPMMQTPQINGRVKKTRHDDEEHGKLFVGGLSWDTTQDSLLRYFSRFGEVIDCVVMKNAETGRSRRFGFVTFNDPLKVDAVLASCPHTLDGRTIDPKSCNPRSMPKPKKAPYLPKVFLGGLPSSITESDLRSFFSNYGEVCEVVIMYDQEKKKSRGFGFLSFTDESACARAVVEHYVTIQNKKVEIKRAEPRTNNGQGGGDYANSPSNFGNGSSPEFCLQMTQAPPPAQVNYNVPPPSATPLPLTSPVPAQSQPNWGVVPPPPTSCVYTSAYSTPPPQAVHIPTQQFWPTVATPPPAQQPPPNPVVPFQSQKWGFSVPVSMYQQYQPQPPQPQPMPLTMTLTSPPPQAHKLPYTSPDIYQSSVMYGQIPSVPAGAADFITNGSLGPQRVNANFATLPSSQVQSYHPYRRS